MIAYLLTQLDRMNEDQKKLVERTAKMHEDEWLKIERERLASLYVAAYESWVCCRKKIRLQS